MYKVREQDLRPRKPELVPATPALLPQVHAAAQADGGHAVLSPTHVAQRGGRVVGYGSLGKLPMMFAWLDTKALTARESFALWREAEKTLQGRGTVVVPCGTDSPLLPFMEKLGYQKLGTAHIFVKEF